MADRKPKKAFGYFIITAVLLAFFAYKQGNFDGMDNPLEVVNKIASYQDLDPEYEASLKEEEKTLSQTFNNVVLSDYAKEHILYGNNRGGGHKHGIGKPCKSEFPENWSDEKIFFTVKKIAANDNLPWEQQDNGYYVSEYNEGNIRVRVVMGDQKKRVVTAYPTNTKRNPCPANAR